MRELPSPAIHASRTAHSPSSQALRGLVIGGIAAVVLAYLGALGTYQAPFVMRLAYWAAVILPGSLLGMGAQALIRHWGALAGHRWLEVVVVALVMSVPHSFVVIVVSAMFFGTAMITPMVLLQFWLAVLLIALVLTTINHLAAPAQMAAALTSDPAPAPGGQEAPPQTRMSEPVPDRADGAASTASLSALPALLADKLPHRLRAGRLLGIEAEDHYLRVHTDLGSDLVLMRMTDACAMLGECDGARVHRSWWVARGAVAMASSHAGRMELTLVSGQAVPVSRAMQPVLRRSGWV